MANNEGTPLRGDRGAYDTVAHPEIHARDIAEGAFTYHANPDGEGRALTFDSIDDGGTEVLAAGSVDAAITAIYVVAEETGTGTSGGTLTLPADDSAIIYTDGTDTLTLSVSAAGAVTLQRTAGADTFSVALQAVWL